MKWYVLATWANGGVDLNRIEELTPEDFVKISLIRKVI